MRKVIVIGHTIDELSMKTRMLVVERNRAVELVKGWNDDIMSELKDNLRTMKSIEVDVHNTLSLEVFGADAHMCIKADKVSVRSGSLINAAVILATADGVEGTEEWYANTVFVKPVKVEGFVGYYFSTIPTDGFRKTSANAYEVLINARGLTNTEVMRKYVERAWEAEWSDLMETLKASYQYLADEVERRMSDANVLRVLREADALYTADGSPITAHTSSGLLTPEDAAEEIAWSRMQECWPTSEVVSNCSMEDLSDRQLVEWTGFYDDAFKTLSVKAYK